ncbi:hypothetical protein QCA50_000974 [Cerrena zonata]|uniref:Uncharacterized protein n=1 Tax=Cerrena zonata TaxID=2478898 RepID=A0AAW0GYD4_9APHY
MGASFSIASANMLIIYMFLLTPPPPPHYPITYSHPQATAISRRFQHILDPLLDVPQHISPQNSLTTLNDSVVLLLVQRPILDERDRWTHPQLTPPPPPSSEPPTPSSEVYTLSDPSDLTGICHSS